MNQKIQNKRNKRKSRQTKSNEYLKSLNEESKKNKDGIVKLDLSKVDFAPMNRHQNKTNVEGEIDMKEYMSSTSQILHNRYMEWEKKGNPKPELNKNVEGFPLVDLGTPSEKFRKQISVSKDRRISPIPRTMSVGDIKLINAIRMTSPNGNKFPYTSWTIRDSYFEGREIEEKVKVHMCNLKNSTYFGLLEKDGFTEEIFNDAEEMKKYMCWVVRIHFDDDANNTEKTGEQWLFVDCPLYEYELFFLNN